MKHKIMMWLAFLLLTTHIFAIPPKTPPIKTYPMLKGQIVSNELKKIPSFNIYYRGMQTTNNDDGFFSFPIEKTEDQYSLIICKNFTPVFNAVNTIDYLKLNAQKPYQYFRFTKITKSTLQEKIEALEKKQEPLSIKTKLLKKQIENQEKKLDLATKMNLTEKLDGYREKLFSLQTNKKASDKHLKTIAKQLTDFKKRYEDMQSGKPAQTQSAHWFISKRKILTNTFTIPDNCVIVCLNPKTVKTVANWSFSVAPHFTMLPKIVLKENLETRNMKRKQSITRSSLKSKLYDFEKAIFHEARKEIVKVDEKQPNTKVALVQ